LVGGGLNGFRSFASSTSLQQEFATHDALLFYVTTGGVIMAAGFFVLLAWLLFARIASDPALRSALRIAVIGYIVVGVTADMTIANDTGSWIWLLAAATVAGAASNIGGDPEANGSRAPIATRRPRPVAGSSGRVPSAVG
jgi:hypothetical protein